MTQETPERKKKKPWLPVLTALLLLAACLWCVWHFWSQYYEKSSLVAQQEAELASLMEQKKNYESLLGMEPCAARDALPKFQVKPKSEPISEKPAVIPDAAQQASGDVDDIEAACVFLVSVDGNKVMTGSGFFVAPGYVVTNRHVVEKGNGNVLVTSKAMGNPAKGKVVAIGPGSLDCAIVEVPVPDNAKVALLPFAEAVKKTEKIGAWGYPNLVGKNDPAYNRLLKGDLQATPELSYSEGVVSAILERDPRLIVHTAPISPGNSGGPLVNSSGAVTGINTLITLDEDSYRQASIAISAEDVKKFLTAHGIKLTTAKAAKPE